MEEKKRIAPAAIVAAALVLAIFLAMAMPLYSVSVRSPNRSYSYGYGYYRYTYYDIEYTFYDTIEQALDNIDEVWATFFLITCLLIVGAFVFSFLGIFIRKAGIGGSICAGIGANALLITPFCATNISEIGVGGVLIFLLLIPVMILNIVVASKKAKATAAAVPVTATVPVAPAVTMCPNCRSFLPVGSVACNVCGTMIAAPVAPAATQFCAGCGAPLEAGMSFCRGCGRPTPPPVPTSYQ